MMCCVGRQKYHIIRGRRRSLVFFCQLKSLRKKREINNKLEAIVTVGLKKKIKIKIIIIKYN